MSNRKYKDLTILDSASYVDIGNLHRSCEFQWRAMVKSKYKKWPILAYQDATSGNAVNEVEASYPMSKSFQIRYEELLQTG